MMTGIPLLAAAVAIPLVFVQDGVPEISDVTVAGKIYDVRSGVPLQIYREDLVRGAVIVRGKVERHGAAGPLAVQVSIDDGKTWRAADGVEEWSFAFRPAVGVRHVVRARVVLLQPLPSPYLQLKFERLELVDAFGEPMTPISGKYVYSGKVRIRAQVGNLGSKPATGLSIVWRMEGEQGALLEDLALAPGDLKDISADLPDLGGEPRTLHLVAVMGGAEVGGQTFQFVPAVMKKSWLSISGLKVFQIDPKTGGKTEVPKSPAGYATSPGAKYWVELDVANESSKPQFNVTVNAWSNVLPSKSGGKAGWIHGGTFALIPPGGSKKIGMEIAAANLEGIVNFLLGDDKEGGGLSAQFGNVAMPGLKPMKVRLASVDFYVQPAVDLVNPGKSATLEKFWGEGRILAPLGSLPDLRIPFMMESAPASVSKSGQITGLATVWALPMPGQGVPMVQYGDVLYRLQRMDLHMPKGIQASGNGWVSLVGTFAHPLAGEFQCDLPKVTNLHDFYGIFPGKAFSLAKGQAVFDCEQIAVDFSPSWSPTTPPVGLMGATGQIPPMWKGAMAWGGSAVAQPAALGFPSNAGTITAKGGFILIEENGLRGIFHVPQHGFTLDGFKVMVAGAAVLENELFKPFELTKAAVHVPSWFAAQLAMELKDPQNKIASGQVDLYDSKPTPALERVVQGVKVTFPPQSYVADMSVVRSAPSLPSGWVGFFCQDAVIEYKGQKKNIPVQILSGEWIGTAAFGGTDAVQGGVTVKKGATVIKLVGPGNVEISEDTKGLLLPPGIFVIKQSKYVGPIGETWMDTSSLIGDIPGPWTFAFGAVRVSVDKVKLTAQGLEIGDGWFLPPAEVSTSWLPYEGSLALKGGAFEGQLKLGKFVWSPPGWSALTLDLAASTALIEKNAVMKIAVQGAVKLGTGIDPVPLSPNAAFLPAAQGQLGFVDTTFGPKIDLLGGAALEAGMEMTLDWNSAVGFPPAWTGVMLKDGKLRAPPLLGSASIPYASLQIAPSGVAGSVPFAQAIASNPAAGVSVEISKGVLHVAGGRLVGGELDGGMSFPFDGMTLAANFAGLKLEGDASGAKFGMRGTDISMPPAPFPYKGMNVSISKIDVDLSEISNLPGVAESASWKGIRIAAGTIQIPLAVPSKSGDPVAFSMENTTFQFGGGLSGQFKVAAPVDLELLDPKGFRLEITGGWMELSNGAISGQSLDGACALPASYGGLNPRAQFKGASIAANGDLFATDAKFLAAKLGPYTFGSGNVTIDLSSSQSPPGRSAGWKGLALQNAWFAYGQFGEKLFYIDGQTMSVDSSGLTAKIAATTNQAGEYGGFELAVKKIAFEILDSQFLGGTVEADLLMPQPQWKGTLKLSLELGAAGIASGKAMGSGIVEVPDLGLKVAPSAAKLTAIGKKGWVQLAGLLGITGKGMEVTGVAFTDLRVHNNATFAFGTGDPLYLSKTVQGKFHGYPIGVEKIEFGKDGSQLFARVGGKLEISEVIPAKYVEASLTTAPLGSPAKSSCDSISISGSWSGVSFTGTAHFFDDPKRGKGFEADLALKVSTGLDFSLDGKFLSGALADYRYWRVGANLQLPAGSGIPLGTTGLSIYGFQGGLAYNMKVNPSDGSFTPQKGGWVFSGGTTLGTLDDGYTFNADATLSISSGPIFMFEGDFWMLCPRQARSDRIKGGVQIVLGGGALKGNAWVHAEFYGAVKADGSLEFYFPTNGAWHIRMGTKGSPISAKVLHGPSGKAWVTVGAQEFTIGVTVDMISQQGSVGPLSGEIKISVGGEVGVQRNPFHFSGQVWASGHVKGSVEVPLLPDPSVSVGVSGWLNVSGPDPTKLSGGIWVGVEVCGVSVGGHFNVSKSW